MYLCNVIPEYCFSIGRKSLSFRFAKSDDFTSTFESYIATYYECLIGLKLIFGHKFILKCDLFGFKTFVVICILLLVVSQQSSTAIPAATPNNASFSFRAISDPLKHLASIMCINIFNVNVKMFVSVGLQRCRLAQS